MKNIILAATVAMTTLATAPTMFSSSALAQAITPTNANGNDWENQYLLQRNREPARASFTPFGEQAGDRSLSLNGEWRFRWSPTPEGLPQDFFLTDFNDDSWAMFPVPGDWEVNGYGTPIYSSSGYTFKINPPYVMGEPKKTYTAFVERNPTGLYRRTFTLPEQWQGQEVYICFGAVAGAFYLYVNGQEVGYSQGSMEPAEFRLTPYLRSGENVVALRVMKYCDGSYLEDQDMWRFGGIHRSVTLYATPQIRIADVGVRTEINDSYTTGTLIIDPKLSAIEGHKAVGYTVQAQLYDADGKAVFSRWLTQDADTLLNLDHKAKIMNARTPQRGYAAWGWLVGEVKRPQLWSAETPYLYTLRLQLIDSEGRVAEQVETKVGFRRLEISDGRLLVNGKQVRLRGVNRHEMDPRTAKVMSEERMQREIRLLKQANINAVRTCHYPDCERWYELCDEYGIYLMDEADIEEHGLRGQLASDPTWVAAFMDRTQRLVVRDRNHPSVIFWSLGNESGWGPNFAATAAWIHEYDPTRFVHYEGAQGDDNCDPQSVDVISRFYPRLLDDYLNPGVKDNNMERPENARWERLLAIARKTSDNRPVLTSEYAHAMGNALGNFKDYWDEIYSHDRMLGGFIWEWSDGGIYQQRADGRTQTSYGGDFGDVPNLGAFCVKGIVTADCQPTPKYYEVKQVYSPVQLVMDGGEVRIVKRDEHFNVDDCKLTYELTENGRVKSRGDLKSVGSLKYNSNCDVRLNVRLVLAKERPWAKAGHVVCTQQFVLNDRMITAFTAASLNTRRQASVGEATAWLSMVQPHIFRAPMDNDRGFGNWIAKDWTNNKLDSAEHVVVEPVTAVVNDNGTVTVTAAVESRLLNGQVRTDYVYTMDCDGNVDFYAAYTPEGEVPPLPCMGSTFVLPKEWQQVQWYGMGERYEAPFGDGAAVVQDTYPDRLAAAHIGLWSSTVGEQYVHYARPQFSGNHEQTVRLTISNDKGKAGYVITAEDGQPFAFSALPYSTAQLCATKHDCDLETESNVYLSIDAAVMGLGNSSCGPGVLTKYAIPNKTHSLHVRFTKIK